MSKTSHSEDHEAFDADDAVEAEVADGGDRETAELNEKYLRTLADFQNFKRRSIENEQRERSAGIAAVARNLVPVLDQFDLALAASGDADSLREGMKLIRQELLKVLSKSGVETIEPSIGDEFAPAMHEAVMRQPAEGVAPDAISMVLQPGYRLGEMVIRPAKVAIAPEA
ncbi:MAG: nucleotide exchange factor GrpE [Phycisphaerales bacterium]|jgi:molecular chaperone GrpE